METALFAILSLAVALTAGQTVIDDVMLKGIILQCKSGYTGIYNGCNPRPTATVCSFYHNHNLFHGSSNGGNGIHTADMALIADYDQYCGPWCSLCPPTTQSPAGDKCLYSSVFRKRIANGSPARQCDYPWMVAIRTNPVTSDPVYMCSGVLKDGTTVITSRTCEDTLRGVNPNVALECVVGEHAWNAETPDDDVIPCTLVTSTSTDSGISELTLNTYPPHYMSRCIAPACFQNQQTDPDLSDCIIASWGATHGPPNAALSISSVLLSGSVPTVRNCAAEARGINSVTSPDTFEEPVNNILCIDSPGSTLISPTSTKGCLGDEGGALMCRDRATSEWITVGVIDQGGCPLTTWFREITP